MTTQATAATSSWHHPISRLWLCHVSVHMLWQNQYIQIGKQGDQVPPEAFRESQGMRGKSSGFLTEEDPAVWEGGGGVRSSCQLKYLKEIFSVFKILFIPPSIPLAVLLNCSSSTLFHCYSHCVLCFPEFRTALKSRHGCRNFLSVKESPLPAEQVVLEPESEQGR